MRRLIPSVLAIGALCALGGGVTTPASADICAISAEMVGNYEVRTVPSKVCTTLGTPSNKKYIKVQTIGTRIPGTSVSCAPVVEPLTGNYTNATCTTAAPPTGGSYVKIKINLLALGAFLVEGKDVKELPAAIQVTKLTTAKAVLKAKVLGAEVKFTTSTAPELVGFKLASEDVVTTGGTVKFKGVTTELNGKASAVCTPLGEKGKEASLGTITTKELSGRLISPEGSAVTQLLPQKTGNVMATFFFGEECSLPSEMSVITKKETGKGLVLTDPLGIGKELAEHEAVELSGSTELWLNSETAEHKVTIEGAAAVGMTDSHAGKKWSGTPDSFEVE